MRESIKNKYIGQLKKLISEGKELYSYERKGEMNFGFLDELGVESIVSWQIRVINVMKLAFGENSTQYKSIIENMPQHINKIQHLRQYVGICNGALRDLEDGFINGVESLISGDIFDTVLQDAKELNDKGYKDPAAVLTRVVIEQTLQKLAKKNGIDPDQKASALNTNLKKNEIYNKAQWRLIQARLDIGNHAAHGEFTEFTQSDVKDMIQDAERFISQFLTIS